MWRATVGAKPAIVNNGDDDWDTDPDFVNDVSEKEQRWGSKTIEGSGHQASVNLSELRKEAIKADEIQLERKMAEMPRASEGYGGKFGVQKDRMDKCAENFDYKSEVAAHASQKDVAAGYGGKFGVQTDRVDKSALGWDEKVELSKHDSQKDAASGYGGRYGVQTDRIDKSAIGWDAKVELSKHDSQKDAACGYGGKYGVQKDRVDQSASGWDDKGTVALHESQTDYKKGFGGKYGVQTDRQDKSAAGWEDKADVAPHESQTDYKKGFGGKYGVQTDRQDKSAAGWEEKGNVAPHESQLDYKKGFGGKFGVQSDRQDKSAVGFEHHEQLSQHESQSFHKGIRSADDQTRGETEAPRQFQREKPVVSSKASDLRARFEHMGTHESVDRVAAEKERRKKEDETLREQQREEEEKRQQRVEAEWEKRGAAGLIQETDIDHEEEERQRRIRESTKQFSRGPAPGAVSIIPGLQAPLSSIQPTLSQYEEPPVLEIEKPEQPDVPQLAPIAVFPVGLSLSGAPSTMKTAFRRAPSTDDEVANDEDWEEDEKSQKQHTITSPTPIAGAALTGQQTHTPLAQSAKHGARPEVEMPTAASNVATSHFSNRYEEPPYEEISQPPPPSASIQESKGLTAIALYDYQKQDNDEISFEPDDLITNIEQVDAGWWRGVCNGQYGLFPANYVELR